MAGLLSAALGSTTGIAFAQTPAAPPSAIPIYSGDLRQIDENLKSPPAATDLEMPVMAPLPLNASPKLLADRKDLMAKAVQEAMEEQEKAEYQNPLFESGEERRSSGHILDTTLSVVYGERKAWRPEIPKPGSPGVKIPAGAVDLKLRSYDALPVGPTLRVKPGDVLRVKMRNGLPVEKLPVGDHDDPAVQNKPHEYNRTNLHTHGLHVTPAGNGDNVLVEVRPGEEHLTEMAIPEDHIPGTFWYHSHVHGSTAMQVASGMAGALIVEAREDDVHALDNLKGIKEAEERVMVFQQISYLPEDPTKAGSTDIKYVLEDFSSAFAFGRWTKGKLEDGWRTTINGQLQPRIRVKSGKTQRLRLIHGGVREVINVQVSPYLGEGQVYDRNQLSTDGMREIARDGIALNQMQPTTSVQLYPGYRSDVLLKLNNPGNTLLRYILWDGQGDNVRSLDISEQKAGDSADKAGILAIIEVEPAQPDVAEDAWPSPQDFAQVRRPNAIPESEIVGRQRVDFNVSNGLTINGHAYDRNDPPLNLKLGRADEWLLSSSGASHPFHIHVNPFYVISETTKDGKTTLHNAWKDTLFVTPSSQFRVATRYEDYLGDFVIHCHILDHEDQGMMQAIRISSSAYEIGTKLAKPYYASHWALPDNAGTKQALTSLLGDDLSVLVFLESQSCTACARQTKEYWDRSKPGSPNPLPVGVKVIFVAPGKPGDVAEFPGAGFPFPVVFDEKLAQYREYGCYQSEFKAPLHGTFILNKQAKVFWREISGRPYEDLDTLFFDLDLIKKQNALEAGRNP